MSASGDSPAHILVVEDDDHSRELLTGVLEHSGQQLAAEIVVLDDEDVGGGVVASGHRARRHPLH